jgi:adenylate cyclase
MTSRPGVRGRLLLAFFGISAFAVFAAVAAMYSFLEVGKALHRITHDRVPATVASQQLSRQAERIAAAAPALLTVDSADAHEQMAEKISAELERLDNLLKVLKGRDVDRESLILIENLVDRMGANLAVVETMMINYLVLVERTRELLRELASTDISSRRLLAPGILVIGAKLYDLEEMLEAQDGGEILGTGEIAALAKPIISLSPLQQAQTEVSTINDRLINASSAPSLADLEVLKFPLRRSLSAFEESLEGVESDLGAKLGARLAEYREFIDGKDSIVGARASELRHLALMQTLLDENVDISRQLTGAVDRLVADASRDIQDANLDALSVQEWGTKVMFAVVGLSLLSSILIVWLYVGRNLIARLTALSDSMLAIAGGNLRAPLPAPGGGDEISRMAEALVVFRDTAIEVEESNMRDIEEARRRLIDAIENSSEGFAFYDPGDRLVICNSRYKELLYSGLDVAIEPGMAFEEIIRRSAEGGLITAAEGRIDEWVAERLVVHRDPGEPRIQQRGGRQWILITERKTGDGGTVAIYSDITDLKQREEDLTKKSNALEQLSNQLAKYLSPQVYDSIFSGRQEVKLVSQRKRLTVFFSDLVGFTATAERLESEDLTRLLNQYLTEMSQIAVAHGATIDKYVGDAIVIFFGDPETLGVKEDAIACVTMAIAMRKRMKELESVWMEAGLEKPLQCRMGINTGMCTVGNFGSEDRMDYTIIGGGVNLAARLETACPANEILISYETYAHVKDLIECEEEGQIEVKGISHPVSTQRVVDLYENLGEGKQPIRAKMPHMRLDVETNQMTPTERRNAAAALLEAAKCLSKIDAKE